MKKSLYLFLSLLLLSLTAGVAVRAQTLADTSTALGVASAAAGAAAAAPSAPVPGTPAAAGAPGAVSAAPAPVVADVLTPEERARPFKDSFFLSPLEIAAIQQALAGRTVSQQTLAGDSKAIPQSRKIRLSGVLYRSPEDWIVWMNNQKVTPDNLLPEIIDINVQDSSNVDLKWYDVGLNQVISITMHPHQVYDIVTGILLPGAK